MAERRVVISADRGLEQTWRARLATLWPLLGLWTGRELTARYRQSVLSAGWSLLQPVALLVTYGWVLTAVLGVTPADAPYLTFAWAGLVPFTLFSQSLALGVGSIQQSGPLVTRVAFPREVLPLSVVACALVDATVMGVLLVAVAWVQVGPPTVTLIGVLVPIALVLAWSAATTVVFAAVTVFRRDLNHATPLLLRVLFIVTPVLYPAILLEERIGDLALLNPLGVAIEATRDTTYRGLWPDMAVLGPHLVVAAVALVGALWLFVRIEARMVDHA